MYKSIPIFQVKNTDIFESSNVYKSTPMIDDTKQNKIFFLNIFENFGVFFKNFVPVLVKVQFLGYKFGLKGSTYT